MAPTSVTTSASLITLQPIARAEAPVLGALFELYAYDFSEFMPLELKPSGRFEVTPGDAWWTEADHHPFFIRGDGSRLLGFALARKGSRVTQRRDVMDIAEFFVVRGARKQNVGLAAASKLLQAFPGSWEIRVRHTNRAAVRFWPRVAAAWPGSHTTRSFETPDAAGWDLHCLEQEQQH